MRPQVSFLAINEGVEKIFALRIAWGSVQSSVVSFTASLVVVRFAYQVLVRISSLFECRLLICLESSGVMLYHVVKN